MKIYLVAATSFKGLELFLADKGLFWTERELVGDCERVVEAAGRVCYMSFGPHQHRLENSSYVANLLKQGHESVLEHASFTVLIDGITRALSHQLVRHRAGFSYSQLSQQYHDESEAGVIEPPVELADAGLRERWDKWLAETRSIYSALLASSTKIGNDAGLSAREQSRYARSVARMVMPNATSTTLMISANARAWRTFFRARGAIRGDREMRDYSVAVFKILSGEAPNLFADFSVRADAQGEYLEIAN